MGKNKFEAKNGASFDGDILTQSYYMRAVCRAFSILNFMRE